MWCVCVKLTKRCVCVKLTKRCVCSQPRASETRCYNHDGNEVVCRFEAGAFEAPARRIQPQDPKFEQLVRCCSTQRAPSSATTSGSNDGIGSQSNCKCQGHRAQERKVEQDQQVQRLRQAEATRQVRRGAKATHSVRDQRRAARQSRVCFADHRTGASHHPRGGRARTRKGARTRRRGQDS